MMTVNDIVLPDLSEKVVLESVRAAQKGFEEKENAERDTALDFYYHRNVDQHIEQWFSPSTLEQVPVFPQKIVPRFSRARNMLYKNAPKRMINGEQANDYLAMTHHLDTVTREFNETAWLTGSMAFRSKFGRDKVEYDIIPNYKRYYLDGESHPFGVSYEVGRDHRNNRIFVFWSEAREGVPGIHMKFDQAGRVIQVNEDNVNPYGVIPVTFVDYTTSASDVIRAAIQIGIANTEIALAERFAFGQPVVTGADEVSKIKLGIDRVLLLGEGQTFSFVGNPGSLTEMIEVSKSFANQTAINNHLRIKWDESGNAPSGTALKIMEMENLESRVSDIPKWRDWEHERYKVDREIIRVHTGKDMGENYRVDFAEVEFPLDQSEEFARLEFMMDKGLMDRTDLIRHFNPDISDEDLEKLMNRVDENKKKEAQAQQPEQPQFEGLKRLGTISS
jgi:hypothetical protein|tara:strand:+ start:1170 stop:2510 length:1341 start_codon:yes stop_codon:yes gene_type:complete